METHSHTYLRPATDKNNKNKSVVSNPRAQSALRSKVYELKARRDESFDIQAKRHNIEETNLRIMEEDHEVNVEAPNELSTDEQKYAYALTQVNAQAVAKVLEQLPTKGNEEAIYQITRIIARLKVKQIIEDLVEHERYRDARIINPVTWIDDVLSKKMPSALHPVLKDMSVYLGVEKLYTSLALLRQRIKSDIFKA